MKLWMIIIKIYKKENKVEEMPNCNVITLGKTRLNSMKVIFLRENLNVSLLNIY